MRYFVMTPNARVFFLCYFLTRQKWHVVTARLKQVDDANANVKENIATNILRRVHHNVSVQESVHHARQNNEEELCLPFQQPSQEQQPLAQRCMQHVVNVRNVR
jgi:hypothetical protein